MGVFRKGSNGHPLFLAVRKPHGGVPSSTVYRWLRNILGCAGIDTENFKSHSTRAAATSKARTMGVSLRDILKAAN